MSERVIRFDCVACGKRYAAPASSAGTHHVCPCGRESRVPARSTVGNERDSPWGWLVARLVYGLGGALFGLLIVATLARMAFREDSLPQLLVMGPSAGFLLGFLGGESFVNFIGRKIRDREESRR